MKQRKKNIVDNSSANTYVMIAMLCAFLMYSISPYALILIGFGMLPAFIAIIIDQERGKYISHIVTCLNLAGLVPYLYKIFKYKTTSTAIDIIVDPKTWLVIFGAASVGWIIYWILPQFAVMCYTMITKARLASLNTELDELAKEWGEEIKK